MKERKYYMDWLRVIAILCVFVYHCTRFFDNEDWHVKAALAQQADWIGMVRELVMWVWLMELFFLAAGFGARYMLRNRKAGQYLLDRAKRLLIPLYTVGLFILIVPQAYFERFTHGQVSGTFWQWLPGFFRGLPGEIFSTPWWADPIELLPYSFSGHLWFIQMLFIIVLVTLPLLLFLKSERGERFTARLAGWCARPGGFLLFALPLAAVRMGLDWLPITTDRTWVDFLWYALYFVYGFIIAGDERFVESFKKNIWLSLGLWVGLFLVVGGVMKLALGFNLDSGMGFSLPFAVWQFFHSLVCWCSMAFLIGIGAKYLNFNNKFLAYSSEAVLPFYLFHQTVILIVGWFVLPWNMSGFAKFLIILVISFPVIMILYEVCVRRIGFMRFLFGMPPRRK